MLKSHAKVDNCLTHKRGSIVAKKTKNRLESKTEKGFALIEVLAAIVILSIVSLVLTSYFSNALSYANTNQNKTVMVNLARNALFYVEKQDFDKMEKYFNLSGGNPNASKGSYPNISTEQCAPDRCSQLFRSPELLESVLNPSINGVAYNITISYQSELHSKMKAEGSKAEMAKYLLPVKVTVSSSIGGSNATIVEGYITDGRIR
ncbi:type IV pilus modification PilV family protein [Paenibacillus glacialis]|uniref:Prepilin-type N-terminal cleavage/methylation domain-containing protein n=1 Tax=Paenibacillus glacialis TaxID=494026 RepID=A0A162K4N2_9BACL|nr:prepilin-type N-terminal cleavage/methylation domain-containing protein [Paenibacillus glacialis]OAB42956.1 hypothetical protein PGLA_10905 [Paenibacillus glacialis]